MSKVFARLVHTRNQFKVAIVGAGPAGFYSAERLLKYMINIHVDFFERLPVPFGLARYGVAPDHAEVKNCIHRFEELLQSRNVSYFGNINVPRDISLLKLRESYHAVILAYGASDERSLNVVGESTPGVIGANTFVGWYNGHPDHSRTEINFHDKETAVIVGNGNVALDIARILLKSPDVLSTTDISSSALDKLRKSSLKNVHIIGRRGPLQTSFTAKELREICSLPGINIHIDKELLQSSIEAQQGELAKNRPLRRLIDILITALAKPKITSNRNLYFEFLLSAQSIQSNPISNRISDITLEKNVLDDTLTKIIPTGIVKRIPCDILFKSIGYRNVTINNLPYDFRRGHIKHDGGRVLDQSGDPLSGLYVSGWLKTGPSGVIATTMYQSQSTADSIIKDIQEARLAVDYKPGSSGIARILSTKQIVNYNDWHNIDLCELDAGIARNKIREKIIDWHTMLDVARTYQIEVDVPATDVIVETKETPYIE